MALANLPSVLCNAKVKEPLHVIGKGSYGEVVEMVYLGISVAGKRIHQTFFTPTPTNEEVQSVNKFFQNECTRYVCTCMCVYNIYHDEATHQRVAML